MSNSSTVAVEAEAQTGQKETLFAALIPCVDVNLLLPNLLVSTTVGLEALQPVQSAPAWLAGSVRVHGARVPVLRVEMLLRSGAETAGENAMHRRSRIVVLRAASFEPAFAIVAIGVPRLVNVNALVLRPLARHGDDNEKYCACRAQLGHTEVLIPNVDALARSTEGW